MSLHCVFPEEPVAEGIWKCVRCGWQNVKPRERPVRRNCGEAPEGPPRRSDARMDYLIARACAKCKYWRKRMCQYDKGCRKCKDPKQWRQRARNPIYSCPIGLWVRLETEMVS
jgi:hypothetical protein